MQGTVSLQELEKLVVNFSKHKIYKYDESTIKNFFVKKNRKEYDKKSFMFALHDNTLGKFVGQDEFAGAVKQVVCANTRSKETAIDLCKRFTAYVEKKTGICFYVKYPPIQTNSSFERLMFLSKYIQSQEIEISELEDILWISDRTIQADIAKLKGNDDDPIQICGKKFIVEDLTLKKDHVHDLPSTVHPLFLTFNVTQVIATLKGLKEMSQARELYSYSMKAACEIWEQLSDIAKERILYVTKEMMPEDEQWFRKLANLGDNRFWPEYQCSEHGDDAIMECMKNQGLSYIEYQIGDETQLLKDVEILQIYSETIKVRIAGEIKELKKDCIIKCKTSPLLVV